MIKKKIFVTCKEWIKLISTVFNCTHITWLQLNPLDIFWFHIAIGQYVIGNSLFYYCSVRMPLFKLHRIVYEKKKMAAGVLVVINMNRGSGTGSLFGLEDKAPWTSWMFGGFTDSPRPHKQDTRGSDTIPATSFNTFHGGYFSSFKRILKQREICQKSWNPGKSQTRMKVSVKWSHIYKSKL